MEGWGRALVKKSLAIEQDVPTQEESLEDRERGSLLPSSPLPLIRSGTLAPSCLGGRGRMDRIVFFIIKNIRLVKNYSEGALSFFSFGTICMMGVVCGTLVCDREDQPHGP